MGIFWPLKESPHCQLPTIIKQPCRVYHWLCLTSLIRQECATYIGQQRSTAYIAVPHFQTMFHLLPKCKASLKSLHMTKHKANLIFYNILCRQVDLICQQKHQLYLNLLCYEVDLHPLCFVLKLSSLFCEFMKQVYLKQSVGMLASSHDRALT